MTKETNLVKFVAVYIATLLILIPLALASAISDVYNTPQLTLEENGVGEVTSDLPSRVFSWAKNAVSSLTRKSASDAFRSPGAMMESKTGSLGAPTKTVTQTFRQFEGKDVPSPKYPISNDKHILQGHHDLHLEPDNSKFLSGEGGQKFADEVYSKGDIKQTFSNRYMIDADLGRVVGTRGEMGGRIIIDRETGKVITQFPKKVQ